MKSLNTYNYHEQLYMKPISYQVSISDDDKIIKIEEDGDLIAEVSFAIDRNVLFLNGKDGLEVAQIELPVSMASITNQVYDADTKSIDLTILQSNGESVIFSLDVAELVNVYTAGDGIDITDNVISIKIKDASGKLTVDEDGLDINLDSVESEISEVNNHISSLKAEITSLRDYTDDRTNELHGKIDYENQLIKEKIEQTNAALGQEIIQRLENDDALKSSLLEEASLREELEERVRKEVASLVDSDMLIQQSIADEKEAREVRDSELNAKINVEMAERIAADEDLQNQIGDVKGELEGSISDAITDLQNQIGDVKGSLEGSISEEIGKIKEEIGDVKGELEGSIAEEIGKIKEEISEVKGELEGSISDAITDLQNQIGDVKGELEGSIADAIVTLEEEHKVLDGKISNESAIREKADAELKEEVFNTFVKFKEAIDVEVSAREENDRMTLNQLSIEKEERKSTDEDLKKHIITSREELASSISLEKDANNNLKYYLHVDGRIAGEINIPADKMLETVSYDEEAKTLTFVWNTSLQQSPTVIDISDLVDEYIAGDGLLLEGKTFKVNVTTSKYVGVNENGSLEFIGEFVKTDGASWKYELIGTNGLNNGKVIDFSADYEAFDSHIKEVYAPLTYVDAQDLSVKSELIGAEGDAAEVNTLYGLRSAIAKSEEVSFAKIAEEQLRAENAEKALAESLETSIAETDAFIADEIARVEGVISEKEIAADEKHKEMAQNIKANSDILASLTNGEQTGVVDKLDRQFHEVTKNLDETAFEGLLKSMMDRITQLESVISVLTSGADVQGSVANVVANSLNEAKLYAQEQDALSSSAIKEYADNKFQLKGDYLTEVDAKYITEEELASYNYVDKVSMSNDLLTAKSDVLQIVNKNYQPIGNYLTEVPTEYITETELETKHYASIEYVNSQDDKLLSKDMGDLLYAKIDTNDKYVTTSQLLDKKYVNESQLADSTSDMATKTWVDSNYQAKGDYISQVPSEFVTESELSLFLTPYAKEAFVHSLLDGVKNDIVRLDNSKLDTSMADTKYQQIGSYVTSSELAEKHYVSQGEMILALSSKADISYVSSEISKLNLSNYVTKSELASKNYIDSSALDAKGYVTLTHLNGAIADMQTKSDASATYVTKVAFDEYKKVAFSANNIVAGDNIKIAVEGANIRLGVKLSDSYNVVDSFGQNLPSKGENLDMVSMKLSEAIKKLHDTTDGELF